MGPATPRAFDSSGCFVVLVGVRKLGMFFGILFLAFWGIKLV